MAKQAEWADLDKKLGPNAAWWQIARHHGNANDSFTTITLGSPEHAAWLAHCQNNGYVPVCLSFQRCTMPAKWPIKP